MSLRNAVRLLSPFYVPRFPSHQGAVNANAKLAECYLGLLYAMEDVAVYGYITPSKVKIVIALALSDSVVRDVEVNMVRTRLSLQHAYS